jgi:hypothetical protein
LKDQEVGAWTSLKRILERREDVDSIDLVQDRDQSRAPVSTAINLWA